MQATQLESLRHEIRRANRRSVFAVIGGSLIVSAAVIFSLDGYSKFMAAGAPIHTWALGVLVIIFLLARLAG